MALVSFLLQKPPLVNSCFHGLVLSNLYCVQHHKIKAYTFLWYVLTRNPLINCTEIYWPILDSAWLRVKLCNPAPIIRPSMGNQWTTTDSPRFTIVRSCPPHFTLGIYQCWVVLYFYEKPRVWVLNKIRTIFVLVLVSHTNGTENPILSPVLFLGLGFRGFFFFETKLWLGF